MYKSNLEYQDSISILQYNKNKKMLKQINSYQPSSHNSLPSVNDIIALGDIIVAGRSFNEDTDWGNPIFT